jgi:RIMS-binding protein 2
MWLYPLFSFSLSNQLQVELTFQTGQIILVYGDMDEDGFYMGELDGIRGLVPSNFLTDADTHPGGPSASSVAQRSLNNRGRGIMTGPGARGPPPPPRDNMMGGMNQRKGTIL